MKLQDNKSLLKALEGEGFERAMLDDARFHLAFVHPSYAGEMGLSESNQRLEFLGDAVINFVVAEWLYTTQPSSREGAMTNARARLVCSAALAKAARSLSFGDCLELGKGEAHNQGADRISNLEDAFEAFVGALYLVCGMEVARRFLKGVLQEVELQQIVPGDAKGHLLNYAHTQDDMEISYVLVKEEGPDHQKTFTTEVRSAGRVLGRGSGKSKKKSEQAAARDALHYLERTKES